MGPRGEKFPFSFPLQVLREGVSNEVTESPLTWTWGA